MNHVKEFLQTSDKPSSTEVCSEVGTAVTQEHITTHVHQEDAVAIDRERHIHHHQHRVQPIADTVHEKEQHETVVQPEVTREIKQEMPAEHVKLLDGLKTQHKDTRTVGETEYTKSSLGDTVNEHVVHHVHEHITPVIQREVHTHKVVHTVIPIHEVHHDAPIIHESTVLPTISLADFQKKLSLSGEDPTHTGVHHGDKGHQHKVFEGEPRSPAKTQAGAVGHRHGVATIDGKNSTTAAPTAAATTAVPHEQRESLAHKVERKVEDKVDNDVSKSHDHSSHTGGTGTNTFGRSGAGKGYAKPSANTTEPPTRSSASQAI